MPAPLDHLALVDLLPQATATVADLLEDADLRAGVPGCPGWSVHDLVAHLGGVHQWCHAAVRDADPAAGAPRTAPQEAPADADERDALITWYAHHAAAMVEALAAAGDDTPCWGFGPPPRTSGFWWRRQVHEATLHAWDVRSSQHAASPAAVWPDPAVAADGVDEVVSMFYPRQVRTGRCEPLTDAVRLEATDLGDHPGWLLGEETGLPAAGVLRGPVDALLLALWKRTPLDDTRLRVEGDAAVAAALTASLVP